MTADAVAPHLQNLYIVCGTAIPVLFVALAVQTPAGTGITGKLTVEIAAFWPFVPVTMTADVPLRAQTLGLFVMLVGQLASLGALAFDWASVVPEVIAIAGVVAGALFVAASVAPANR
jgi:hypothetical protein